MEQGFLFRRACWRWIAGREGSRPRGSVHDGPDWCGLEWDQVSVWRWAAIACPGQSPLLSPESEDRLPEPHKVQGSSQKDGFRTFPRSPVTQDTGTETRVSRQLVQSSHPPSTTLSSTLHPLTTPGEVSRQKPGRLQLRPWIRWSLFVPSPSTLVTLSKCSASQSLGFPSENWKEGTAKLSLRLLRLL